MGIIRRIDALLSRGWAAAGVEPPRLEPGDRRQIARRAKDAALVALDREPRGPGELARALGLRLVRAPVGGCGGEATSGGVILYRWSQCRATRRALVAHGLAHACLSREGWRHSEADALLLTLDFL